MSEIRSQREVAKGPVVSTSSAAGEGFLLTIFRFVSCGVPIGDGSTSNQLALAAAIYLSFGGW
jgi:hypothetical protein